MSFKLTWRGDEYDQKFGVEILRGITGSALELAELSSESAPLENGDLRANVSVTIEGQVVRPAIAGNSLVPKGKDLSAEVGYTLPYALPQHEDLSYRHDRTDGYKIQTGPRAGQTVNMVAGGRAKYLEGPFITNVSRYLEQIAKRVRRVTE